MTVLGPASEAHTYTILGPTAAAVAVLALGDRNRPGGMFTFALAAAGCGLLLAPVFRDMFPDGSRFQALGPHPVGGLLVLAAVLVDAVGRLGCRSGLADPPVFAFWRVRTATEPGASPTPAPLAAPARMQLSRTAARRSSRSPPPGRARAR